MGGDSVLTRDQRMVELKPWEEVKGVIQSVSEGDDSLGLILISRPILLRVRIPRQQLVGSVPLVGSHIGILRTDTGFRISLIRDSRSAEFTGGVTIDSNPANPEEVWK